jgi:hypothetical protein
MSCSCNRNPCACQGTSGTSWATPDPGTVVVLPFGSKAIQTPQAYPCGAESMAASGVAVGASGTPSAVTPVSFYPSLSADMTTPNIGNQGQLRSANAIQWAIPGLSVWIPPFGLIKVLGVSGDVVTYENQTIPAGTTIMAGATLFPIGPADPTAPPLNNYANGGQILFNETATFTKRRYGIIGMPEGARFAMIEAACSSVVTGASAYSDQSIYGYYGTNQDVPVRLIQLSTENGNNGADSTTAVLPIVEETLAFHTVLSYSGTVTNNWNARIVGFF